MIALAVGLAAAGLLFGLVVDLRSWHRAIDENATPGHDHATPTSVHVLPRPQFAPAAPADQRTPPTPPAPAAAPSVPESPAVADHPPTPPERMASDPWSERLEMPAPLAEEPRTDPWAERLEASAAVAVAPHLAPAPAPAPPSTPSAMVAPPAPAPPAPPLSPAPAAPMPHPTPAVGPAPLSFPALHGPVVELPSPVQPVAGPAPVTLAPILSCRGVHVAYDKVRVLFGVDMDIRPGEIVALLGTNGAGKSTLLKAISGLVDPAEGTILFDGRDITHADAVTRAKLGIVQVPGGKAVFPTLTVAEHFKAAAWLFAREDAAEIHARTTRVLELFPRLHERWHQMAGNLSGGEQQQLGLGMAFVAKPRLLIIDELSLGLAPTVVEQLLGIVRAIHAEGCTVILVEQSVNVALTIAQRAYFMEKGEVRFEGPAAELLHRGDVLRSVFLEGASGSVAAPVGVGSVPATATATAPAPAPSTVAVDRQVALRVRGLTKHFGGIVAVDDVSFDLHQGETLGLIGPNGAGKTTILDLVSGLLPSDGGRVELGGIEIGEWSASRRAAAGLGRSFQDARIFPSLTVTENIALGLERHIETRDHLAALLDLPAVQDSERAVVELVEELIELMNIGAYRDKFVSELSTGVRRIVDLAMVIAHRPSVLLLDEPSSGIAQRETEALGPLLKDIQRATGCSVLIIEHDMPLISAVSDEVIALELGSVVVRDRPERVLADPRVVSSYLGGDVDVINRSGELRSGPAPVGSGLPGWP